MRNGQGDTMKESQGGTTRKDHRDHEEWPARDHKECQIGSTITEGQGETMTGVPPQRARGKP